MTIIKAITACNHDEKMVSQSIRQIKFNELDVLKIDHPTCQASVALQGAHLIFWQPAKAQSPVIWVSDKSSFKKGTAIRGGVPICWPWFGGAGSPSHGFARILDWQLISHNEDNNGVDLVLRLTQSETTKSYWNHDFELTLTLHLGNDCTMDLTCKGDFNATSALHTYFGVSDINNISVSGLGDEYEDRIAKNNLTDEAKSVKIDKEIDRIYTKPEQTSLITDPQRQIKITHYNHSDVVLWNPWIDKSKSMSDMPDDAYQHFVCVETCRINKPIESSANKTSSYGVKIEVI
ncbi:D-hexose-6-phosphate mutarotase [Orbaceae bacterium ac157xtp]